MMCGTYKTWVNLAYIDGRDKYTHTRFHTGHTDINLDSIYAVNPNTNEKIESGNTIDQIIIPDMGNIRENIVLQNTDRKGDLEIVEVEVGDNDENIKKRHVLTENDVVTLEDGEILENAWYGERNKIKDDFSFDAMEKWEPLGNYGQYHQGNGLIRYGDPKLNKWWAKRIIGRFYCIGTTFGASNNGNYVCQELQSGENLIITEKVQKLLLENGNSISQTDLKGILPFDPKIDLPKRVITGYDNPFPGSYINRAITYTGDIGSSDIVSVTMTVCPTNMKGDNILASSWNNTMLIGARNSKTSDGCHSSKHGALGIWLRHTNINSLGTKQYFRIYTGQQCLSNALTVYTHSNYGSYKAPNASSAAKKQMYGNITMADYNNAPRIDRGYGAYRNNTWPYPVKGYYKIRVVHFNQDSRVRILVRPLSKIDSKRKMLARQPISYICACLPRNPLDVNAQFTIFDTMKRRYDLQGSVIYPTANHPNANKTGEMLPHDKVKNFKNGLCRIKMHDGNYLNYNKNGYTSGPGKDGYIWNVEVIYDEGPGNSQTVIIISCGGKYLRWGSGNNVDMSHTRNQCNWRLYSNRIKYNEYKYRATVARENPGGGQWFLHYNHNSCKLCRWSNQQTFEFEFYQYPNGNKREFLLYPAVQLRHVEGAALRVVNDAGEMKADHWYTYSHGGYIDNNWFQDNTFALFKWPSGKVAFRSNRNGKYIYDHGGGAWGYVRATSSGPGAGEDSKIIEITGTPWEAGGEVVIDFGRTGYLAGGIPVWVNSAKYGQDVTSRARLDTGQYRTYYEQELQENDASYWDWYEGIPTGKGQIGGGSISFRTGHHTKGSEYYKGILGDTDIRIYDSSWFLKKSWPKYPKQSIYGVGQLLNQSTGKNQKGDQEGQSSESRRGLGKQLLVGYLGPTAINARTNTEYDSRYSAKAPFSYSTSYSSHDRSPYDKWGHPANSSLVYPRFNRHKYPNYGTIDKKAGYKQGLYGRKYNHYSFSMADSHVINDPKTSGMYTKIHKNPGEGGDYFAYKFSGFYVPTHTGKHYFRTYSDDASYVYIDTGAGGATKTSGSYMGTRVVDNGGTHGGRWREGTINLTAGAIYPIEILFGENTGAFRMIYQFHGPNVSGSPNRYWSDDLLLHNLHRSYAFYHGINLDVELKSKARLEGYAMYPRTNNWSANSRGKRMPSSWRVYGSNDWDKVDSWELVDEKNGVPLETYYTQPTNGHNWGMFNINRDNWKLQGEGFKYYRFTVSQITGGHCLNIQHFQLYGTFEPGIEKEIIQLTGIGKTYYTSQASSDYSSGWNHDEAFDGTLSSGWHDKSPYSYRPTVSTYSFTHEQAMLGATYTGKKFWTEEVDAGGNGTANRYYGQWITVGMGKYGVSQKAVITEVRIHSRKPYMGGVAPRDFRVHGSNDNKSWVRVFEHKGFTYEDYFKRGSDRNSLSNYKYAIAKVPVSAIAAQGSGWKYFRMTIGKVTHGGNSGSIQIMDLQYFGFLEPDKSYEVDSDGVSPNKFLVLNTNRPRKYDEMQCINEFGYFWPKITNRTVRRGDVSEKNYKLAIGGGYLQDEFLATENLYWKDSDSFASYNVDMQAEYNQPHISNSGGTQSGKQFGSYDTYTESRWLTGYYEEECRKRELCGAFIWDKTRQKVYYIKYDKVVLGGKGNMYRGRRLSYKDPYLKQIRHDIPFKLGRELTTLGQKYLIGGKYEGNFELQNWNGDNITRSGGNHKFNSRYDITDIDIYLSPLKELDGGLGDVRDKYNRTVIWEKVWGRHPFSSESSVASTMKKTKGGMANEYVGKGYWRTVYPCDNIKATMAYNRSHQKNIWFYVGKESQVDGKNDRNYGVFAVSLETNAYIYIRSKINGAVSGWHRPTSYASGAVISIVYDRKQRVFIVKNGTSEVWREKYVLPKGADLYCYIGSYHAGATMRDIELSNFGPFVFSPDESPELNPYLGGNIQIGLPGTLGDYIDNTNVQKSLNWIDNSQHFKNSGGVKYRLYDLPLSGHTYSSVHGDNQAIPGIDIHGDARIVKHRQSYPALWMMPSEVAQNELGPRGSSDGTTSGTKTKHWVMLDVKTAARIGGILFGSGAADGRYRNDTATALKVKVSTNGEDWYNQPYVKFENNNTTFTSINRSVLYNKAWFKFEKFVRYVRIYITSYSRYPCGRFGLLVSEGSKLVVNQINEIPSMDIRYAYPLRIPLGQQITHSLNHDHYVGGGWGSRQHIDASLDAPFGWGLAWHKETTTKTDKGEAWWVNMDLLCNKWVGGVLIQGRTYCNQHIRRLAVKTSTNNEDWEEQPWCEFNDAIKNWWRGGRSNEIGDHTFSGNYKYYMVFKEWQFVRHVRIYALAYSVHPSIRCGVAVSLEDGYVSWESGQKKLIWSMDDSIIDEYPSDNARLRQIGFASTPINHWLHPSLGKGMEHKCISTAGYQVLGPHMQRKFKLWQIYRHGHGLNSLVKVPQYAVIDRLNAYSNGGKGSWQAAFNYAKAYGGRLPTLDEARDIVFYNRGDTWIPYWDSEDNAETYAGRNNAWMQVSGNDTWNNTKNARLGKNHTEMYGNTPSWGYHGGGGAYHQWFVWILPPNNMRYHKNNHRNRDPVYQNSYFSPVVEKHIQFRHEVPSTAEFEALTNSWEEESQPIDRAECRMAYENEMDSFTKYWDPRYTEHSSTYARNNVFKYNNERIFWTGRRSWVAIDFKEIKTVTGVYIKGPRTWSNLHYGPFHIWGEYRCDIRGLWSEEKKEVWVNRGSWGTPEKDNNYGKWADRNYNNLNSSKPHSFTNIIDSLYWGGSRLPTVDEARKMKCDTTLNGTTDTWIPCLSPNGVKSYVQINIKDSRKGFTHAEKHTSFPSWGNSGTGGNYASHVIPVMGYGPYIRYLKPIKLPKGERTWNIAFNVAVGVEQPHAFEIHNDGTGLKGNPVIKNSHNDGVSLWGRVEQLYYVRFKHPIMCRHFKFRWDSKNNPLWGGMYFEFATTRKIEFHSMGTGTGNWAGDFIQNSNKYKTHFGEPSGASKYEDPNPDKYKGTYGKFNKPIALDMAKQYVYLFPDNIQWMLARTGGDGSIYFADKTAKVRNRKNEGLNNGFEMIKIEDNYKHITKKKYYTIDLQGTEEHAHQGQSGQVKYQLKCYIEIRKDQNIDDASSTYGFQERLTRRTYLPLGWTPLIQEKWDTFPKCITHVKFLSEEEFPNSFDNILLNKPGYNYQSGLAAYEGGSNVSRDINWDSMYHKSRLQRSSRFVDRIPSLIPSPKWNSQIHTHHRHYQTDKRHGSNGGGGYNTNKLFAGPNRSCNYCNEFHSITKWKETAPRPLMILYSNIPQTTNSLMGKSYWLDGDGGYNWQTTSDQRQSTPGGQIKIWENWTLFNEDYNNTQRYDVYGQWIPQTTNNRNWSADTYTKIIKEWKFNVHNWPPTTGYPRVGGSGIRWIAANINGRTMIEHFRYKVFKKNGNNWNLVGSTTGTTLSVSDGIYVVECTAKTKGISKYYHVGFSKECQIVAVWYPGHGKVRNGKIFNTKMLGDQKHITWDNKGASARDGTRATSFTTLQVAGYGRLVITRKIFRLLKANTNQVLQTIDVPANSNDVTWNPRKEGLFQMEAIFRMNNGVEVNFGKSDVFSFEQPKPDVRFAVRFTCITNINNKSLPTALLNHTAASVRLFNGFSNKTASSVNNMAQKLYIIPKTRLQRYTLTVTMPPLFRQTKTWSRTQQIRWIEMQNSNYIYYLDNPISVDLGPQWASTRVKTYISDLYWMDPTRYPNVTEIWYALYRSGSNGYIRLAESTTLKTRADGFTNEFTNLEKGKQYRIQLIFKDKWGYFFKGTMTNWITVVDERREVNMIYSYLPRSNQVLLEKNSEVVGAVSVWNDLTKIADPTDRNIQKEKGWVEFRKFILKIAGVSLRGGDPDTLYISSRAGSTTDRDPLINLLPRTYTWADISTKAVYWALGGGAGYLF